MNWGDMEDLMRQRQVELHRQAEHRRRMRELRRARVRHEGSVAANFVAIVRRARRSVRRRWKPLTGQPSTPAAGGARPSASLLDRPRAAADANRGGGRL